MADININMSDEKSKTKQDDKEKFDKNVKKGTGFRKISDSVDYYTKTLNDAMKSLKEASEAFTKASTTDGSPNVPETTKAYNEALQKVVSLIEIKTQAELQKAGINRGKAVQDQYKRYKEAKEQAEFNRKIGLAAAGDSDEAIFRVNASYQIELQKAKALLPGEASNNLAVQASVIKDKTVEAIEQTIPGVGKLISVLDKGFDKLGKILNSGVTQASNLAQQYLGSIDARMQGTKENITYEAVKDYVSQFSGSRTVNMKTLTENIGKLAENGIAFNLEERALLQTITDRVSATFDVLEGELPRLVRLQQTDMTQAAAGAEISLNEMLNSLFNDSSYMKDVYDSVSTQLIDATSQLDYNGASAFSQAVQKWMGSLYSLGLSSSAISTLVEGIVSLSTGKVSSLGDNGIGNLLALSAKEAGLSYEDMLTNGLNASNVNDLMKSMVYYLKNIAGMANNNVAKTALSEYTGAGLSYSDLRAIQNISETDITAVYSNVQDFGSATKTLQSNLAKLESRTYVAQQMNNLLENFALAFGNDLTSNPAAYIGWTFGSQLGGVAGGLLQTLAGLQGADAIWNSIQNFVSDFSDASYATILNSLGAAQFTNERGIGYVPTATGVTSGISYSAEGVNATNASTLYGNASSMSGETTAVTGSSKYGVDINQLYAELFETQSRPIRVSLAKVEDSANTSLQTAFKVGANGMLVDVQDNDVNTLISNVYTVRTTR